MKAVADTSPLILLEKAGYLWILKKLCQTVLIPPAVDQEWLRPGSYEVPGWLCVSNLTPEANVAADKLTDKLDKGEAEAIALFQSIGADLLLLDDLKGRKEAISIGLPVTGTVGVLVAAKRKGFLPELGPVLDVLKKHRYYMSEELLAKALLLADEK